MKIGETLKSVGPAIIVAAVVLGPGSILTSSRVGAEFGWLGLPVLAVAVVLMIGMVMLSARLGAAYEGSLCDELASRLGRATAFVVALTLFLIVALFQSSNNMAVVGGLEPLFENDDGESGLRGVGARVAVVVVVNALIIVSLYAMRSVYGLIERAMKVLILLMVAAFLVNFLTALFGAPAEHAAKPDGPADWLPLIGMVGTTFSVAGAFFQSYLVKEKGWGLGDVKKGAIDSVVGISVLGGVTAVILMTSVLMFYRVADAPALESVGDVARQMEPLFGSTAKHVFSVGILAGAFSSFLVNAVIGGTVFADGMGLGSRMEDRWARHFTCLALLTGMSIAIFSFLRAGSTVHLITTAQALTVLGIPALALALLYLATRPELRGERRVPRSLIGLGWVGAGVACYFAVQTALKVWDKVSSSVG